MSIMRSIIMKFDSRVVDRGGCIEIDMDLSASPIGSRWSYDTRFKCVSVVYVMHDGSVVADRRPGILDQRGIYKMIPFAMNPVTQEVE